MPSREAPDQQALDALYRDVFEIDVRGRQVLASLELEFAKPPVLDGTQEGLLKTYVRAAQRALLDRIHIRIARANGQEPAAESDA